MLWPATLRARDGRSASLASARGRGSRTLALILLAAPLAAGGCAAPVIGSITVGQLLGAASAVILATDGKGLSEVALDAATGQDCRVLEGALREDREICEVPGSSATRDDFKGMSTIMEMLEAAEPAKPGAVPGAPDR